MEYFELVLLHELGYRGQYARHLELPRSVGTVQPEPWGLYATKRGDRFLRLAAG